MVCFQVLPGESSSLYKQRGSTAWVRKDGSNEDFWNNLPSKDENGDVCP